MKKLIRILVSVRAITQNLLVSYEYVNKRDKHNVFIALLLINDNESSLRFNGYPILRREF